VRIGVIVLNWNNGQVTTLCLEALGRLNYPASWYIVDNGSSDTSVEVISTWLQAGGKQIAKVRYFGAEARTEWQGAAERGVGDVVLVAVDRNLGYGGGNNVGIGLAMLDGMDAVWVLNNDARPDPSSLDELIAVATGDRVGIVGATVLDDDGSDRVQSVGGGRYRWATSRTSLIGHGYPAGDVTEATLDAPDFITGAAMLLKTAMVADVGGFEEGYHLYCEEMDLAERARARGWQMAVAPGAVVRHRLGATLGSDAHLGRRSRLSYYYSARATVMLTRKFRPFLLPSVVASRLAFMTVLALRRLGSPRAVARGVRDGLGAPLVGDRSLRAILRET